MSQLKLRESAGRREGFSFFDFLNLACKVTYLYLYSKTLKPKAADGHRSGKLHTRGPHS